MSILTYENRRMANSKMSFSLKSPQRGAGVLEPMSEISRTFGVIRMIENLQFPSECGVPITIGFRLQTTIR